ncbi:NACHT, LRR and PYD domains-containing protein 1b allele 5-like isoform X3 [Dendropsophus ebraccatus]|uniref:NACHT, LRR and PYD domains-containing protein 1b allele 5-like isoform X3 n=1 Tax=Dendropsophus ebraccatus TaxID=150705 RepID=UPI003831F357
MASSKLGEDLTCSICQNLYSDSTSLICGHSCCPLCITERLNTQDQSWYYTCPQCGKRPSLQRNTELTQQVEKLQYEREKSDDPSIPDISSYLQCELSLSVALEAEKCPEYNLPLKYYCPQDSAAIDRVWCLLGRHSLNEASKNKDEELTRLKKLLSKKLMGTSLQEKQSVRLEEDPSQIMRAIEKKLRTTDPLSVLKESGQSNKARFHRNKRTDPDLLSREMVRSIGALLTNIFPAGATDDGTVQNVDAVLDSKAPDSGSVGSGPSANTEVYRFWREDSRPGEDFKVAQAGWREKEKVTDSDWRRRPRLRLTSAGRHICPETGIQFVVKGPVVLEYNVESWSSHMTDTLRSQYETVGPLFNVRIQEGPDNVSAVYLPHYLSPQCYKQYKSYIKCVHFKDNKMTVESPTRLAPCYAVLENPSFSCLGALVEKLLTLITRPFTFHGVALIYCKVDTTYSFRLYVMIDNEPRLQSAINKEIGNDFHYICKPPQTNPVSAYKEYMVQGPRGAVIEPELYPYTGITVRDIGEEIQLSIAERSNGSIVWSRSLRREDLDKLRGVTTRSATSGRSQRPSISDKKPCDLTIGQVLGLLSKDHFVDRHRVALIGGIPLVAPLLDDLYQYRLLTAEAYDTVRSRTTAQEQVRQLLGFVNSWGNKDKDEILRSLRSHNLPLVKNLVRKENQAKGIMTSLVVVFLIVSKFKSLKG